MAEKLQNNLSWLSDETDEERGRRESLKAERAEHRNKKSVEWKPTPPMAREQIAKLVVGQDVQIGEEYVLYGFKGKVVKITDDEVEVQAPSLTLYQFDKDGKETSDSRRRRIVSGGPPEELFTGDWHLVPETEPWYILQDEKVQ